MVSVIFNSVWVALLNDSNTVCLDCAWYINLVDFVFLFQGWDDPYVPRTHEGLLKWKYPEMNSVDFLFEVVLVA